MSGPMSDEQLSDGDHTPTTREVRERFIDGFPMDTWIESRSTVGSEFDRWLAEHDQEKDAEIDRLRVECEDWKRAWEGGADATSLADALERADRAEAALARVTDLHRPIHMYEVCDGADCEQEHIETDNDGEYVHEGVVEGTVCDTCLNAYEEQVDYPCDTIRATATGEQTEEGR